MTSSKCKPQHKFELFCISFPLCEMGIIHILMAFVVGIHTMFRCEWKVSDRVPRTQSGLSDAHLACCHGYG